MSKQLKLIVATSKNGVIGRDSTMPWHLPDDLKYFKEKTNGSIIIMGRKTFDSLSGVLPNREHWILLDSKNIFYNCRIYFWKYSKSIGKLVDRNSF